MRQVKHENEDDSIGDAMLALRTAMTTNNIVLLGDSVFDNAAYVGSGPDVITQLRSILPGGWSATLAAVDGSVTGDVIKQIRGIPRAATHLIVSAGGNDALSQAGVLQEPVRSVAEALEELAELRHEFQRSYRRMLEALLSAAKPLAISTIYDPCYPEPRMQKVASTALNVFNDCIIREAVSEGLPVLDLRKICSETADYANPLEPGVPGGRKIAAAILNLVQVHDFAAHRTVIYS